MSRSMQKGRGENYRIRFLKSVSEEGLTVFSASDARRIAEESGIPGSYINKFLSFLTRDGWITRLKRGLYARIGVLSHYYATSGAVFVRPEKRGHMLTDHYIPGLRRADYCQGRSRLSKYVGGLEPSDKDYIAFDRRG